MTGDDGVAATGRPADVDAPGSVGDLRALGEIVRRALAGDPLGTVLDALEEALGRRRPGHRFAVVGSVPGARVHGRHIDLPRRVRTVLDRVMVGLDPGRPARHGDQTRVDGADPIWGPVASDLAAVGLALPLLIGLGVDDGILGLIVAFTETAVGGSDDESVEPVDGRTATVDDLALGPWADITALVLARERDRTRRHATAREEVTGLPSHRLMVVLLREALHRRPGPRVAVIHVGLERIDRLRDAVGGAEADELLRVAARRVRDAVRPEDVLGHTRGGDLVVIVDGLDGEGAGEVAERIRVTLKEPLVTDDRREVAVTPGVGVVVAGPDDTVESLLHKAGIAAREAATTGGTEAVQYRKGTYEAAQERIDIEHDLRRALADGGLSLVYQPQVSLVDGSVLGAEALIRWVRPGQGPVDPETFIPVAEETGLVVELGAWAIDRVLADLADGLPVVASVNLSTRQLDEPSLLDDITAALDRHGVDPVRLRLEVTESTLARDPVRGEARLRSLRDLGVRVSIDDFGTGYAGLENLRRTAVADSLKVDRAFVAGVAEDPRDRAIVAAAVMLGRAIGASVVAEGVETEDQAWVVASLGCDLAQGYWFGPPVPVEELDVGPRSIGRGGSGPA